LLAGLGHLADIGPFHPKFWFSERPVGTPLLLWLCGSNLHLFFLVQTFVFAGSVAALGRAVLEAMRSRLLGWLTVAAIVAVAVQPRFGIWHLEALSESLGSSLGILTFALWLRVGTDPSRRAMILASLATAAWTLTRDVHAGLAVVIIAVLVLAARPTANRSTERRTLLRSAAALGLVVLYVVTSQAISDRNQYPLMNNVGLRVLPDAEMTDSFIERGMPGGEALAARSGRDTWDDDSAFLTSPDLADFRDWVEGRGQLVQMASLVVDADFWIGATTDVLPSAFAYDFADYDRFQSSDRLPDRLFWFGGVQSGTAATVLAIVAGFGLLALAALTGRRPLVAILATAGVICALDFYVSASSDAVEVLRHLIGPVLRFQVIGYVVIGLALDALWGRVTARRGLVREARRVPVRRSTATAVALAAIGLFVAWVGLENRSQDFDPQYARTIVERAARFGGTYYQNGIHNKGPLETAIYDSARWFTSADAYWFGISAYVILAALVIGAAFWFVARAVGATRPLSTAAFALAVIHFTVSTSDYAGVLYSRNMTVALLATSLALALWPRLWTERRRATITFVICGIAIGLAVQTLLTTVFAGAVLAIHLLVARSESTSLRRPARTLAVTVVATVASAPLWYAIRGAFDEFWSGWWTYARFMSAGTGRGLVDQFGLGLTKIVGYYQERPEVVLALVAFVLVTRSEWATMNPERRRLHVLAPTWFVAAWLELVLAQRYSSHYFSVLAVPTMMMAVLAGLSISRVLAFGRGADAASPSGTSMRTTLLACSALILMQGTDIVWSGIEGASKFRGVTEYVAERRDVQSGTTRTTRAVLDLVSSQGDALLAWTMYPWTYLEQQRVPATRFSWKSFLIGEIYLGRTSSEYVLPRTTSWFNADLAESRPTTFVRPVETVLVDGTPMDAVLDTFEQVYLGPDVEVRFARDVWRAALEQRQPIDLRGPESLLAANETSETGWTVDLGRGTEATVATTMSSAPLRLLSTARSGSCWRIDAIVQRPDGDDDNSLRFVFDQAGATDDAISDHQVHLGMDVTRAWSGDLSARYLDHLFEPSAGRALEITVLIGAQAAALVVDGTIVAAVALTGVGEVSLESLSPTTTVTDFRISRADSLVGC
ncbi:MAG: hypothetical protein ACO3SP_06630, partial [Ilumatobacteraceae bacterium]